MKTTDTTIPTMGESDSIKLAILRAARVRIQSKLDLYICVAIRAASHNHRLRERFGVYELQDASDELRLLIRNRLNGCISLELWLMSLGIEPSRETPEGRTKVRETRLAWIDSLIVEHGGTP